MASSVEPEGGGRWAAIARKEAAVKVDVPLLQSTAGLETVVVDANAIIGGGVRLAGVADQFVTVREVLEEVRDPASRFHLATLPLTIRCMEPSSEALAAVTKFSRATGDFQSLSSVDLKLIALAYTVEAEMHGVAHVRSEPPPLLVKNSRVRAKDPPGWGSVQNPEEWECVEENESSGGVKSHILGLKSLNLHVSSSDVAGASAAPAVSNGSKQGEVIASREHDTADNRCEGSCELEQAGSSVLSASLEGSQNSLVAHSTPKNEESVERLDLQEVPRTDSNVQKTRGSSLEGKQTVAGMDASKGEVEDDGWQRASCRSTRRNYLKREAKRSARKQAAERANAETPYSVGDEQANFGAVNVCDRSTGDAHLIKPSDTNEVREEVCAVDHETGSYSDDEGTDPRDLDENYMSMLQACAEDNDARVVDDIASNCTDAPSFRSGDVESEESWMIAPLCKSSIACMTADFAMQNVLLQMGLRLLSTNGMHIRELNKWVLKCQACNHVVSDVGRIFCPKCGNGGTLSKVSVTVGQNGIIHAGRALRVNLRGTRYSLPMPKGGREGAAQNPILREDQLPRAKKTGHLDKSILTDLNFSMTPDKRPQKLAGVKTAAAVFSGRRNPNERRRTVRG